MKHQVNMLEYVKGQCWERHLSFVAFCGGNGCRGGGYNDNDNAVADDDDMCTLQVQCQEHTSVMIGSGCDFFVCGRSKRRKIVKSFVCVPII